MKDKTLKEIKAASRAATLAHNAANGRSLASYWGGKSPKADRRASKKALKGGW
jgi:hypothetical protein